MGTPGTSVLKTLRKYVVDEHELVKGFRIDPNKIKLISPCKSIPQQINQSDCGVFVCQFMNYLCNDHTFNFTYINMDNFRRKIVLELLNRKLFENIRPIHSRIVSHENLSSSHQTNVTSIETNDTIRDKNKVATSHLVDMIMSEETMPNRFKASTNIQQFPIYFLMATNKTKYQNKNATDEKLAMWKYFCQNGCNKNSPPSVPYSFFVSNKTDSTHPLNDETLTFAKQIKMHIINPLDFWLNDKVQKVL